MINLSLIKQLLKKSTSLHTKPGFTIVELLVVIVVIGILAAITIVSYAGISQRAIAASLESDLASAKKQLQIYQTQNDAYPAEVDDCPAPDPGNICLDSSGDNEFSYTVNNSTNPPTFSLTATNNTTVYRITESTVPVALIPPTGILTALSPATIATGTTPRSIIISSDGTSVYATNRSSDTISMYSRNTSTGALTALGTPTIAAGSNPWGITISSDGTSVYAVNGSSGTISMYSRNTSTGALTALGTPTIAAGSSPWCIAISADGNSVYATNYSSNTISMYSRNTSTGALTALGTPTIATGVNPDSIVVSADGNSVYVTIENDFINSTISMYSRNTSTGALTALSTPTISTGANPYAIVVSADGNSVYAVGASANTISMYSRQ
jgi:prepilin-type N-terminal cleavage/methylation domain-containing protein